jgi:hypothetical protein
MEFVTVNLSRAPIIALGRELGPRPASPISNCPLLGAAAVFAVGTAESSYPNGIFDLIKPAIDDVRKVRGNALQDAAIVRAVVQQTRLVSHLHFDAGIKVTCGCTLLSNLSIFFAYHFVHAKLSIPLCRGGRSLLVGGLHLSRSLLVGGLHLSRSLPIDQASLNLFGSFERRFRRRVHYGLVYCPTKKYKHYGKNWMSLDRKKRRIEYRSHIIPHYSHGIIG